MHFVAGYAEKITSKCGAQELGRRNRPLRLSDERGVQYGVERHVMAHAWTLPYFLAQETAVEPVRPCHPCHDLRKSINPSSCEEKAPRRRA